MKKPADAPEGTRLCKKCAEFLPMHHFRTKILGYECRMHMSLRFTAQRKRAMLNPIDKVAINLLSIFRMDGVRVFHLEDTNTRVNQLDILKLFETKCIKPTNQWRIVPIRPDETWGVDNVDIVSKRIRKVLIATIPKTGRDETQLYAKTFSMLVI
jgi:hypothetical protein